MKFSGSDHLRQLFLQQQLISVFSLMERFLSCSFVRQTCDREDSYHKVLASGLLQKRFTKEKKVLNGPDCLTKELLYIEVTNKVIYHKTKVVRSLFKEAFDIDVDLTPIEALIDTRNHIVHRFGHDQYGRMVNVSERCVSDLIETVNIIVRDLAEKIIALPQSEKV